MVYRARQVALDRDVVVKVLFAADEATQRRFDRERRAMGRLSQAPGIAPVYDSGFTPTGQPWLLMPHYERGSLQAVLDERGRLPAEEVRTIGVRVARAVNTAHENGVVHRDIKPANILVSRSGQPDVADFGIAHLLDDSGGRSQALTMTPLYTAPEVFEGVNSGVASDIYSVGALLYALVAGRAAYATTEGATPMLALIRQINEEPLPALPESVPPPLVAVITKAMSKDPARRHESAMALAEDLAGLDLSATATQVFAAPSKVAAVGAAKVADQAPPAPEPRAKRRWLGAALAALLVAVAAVVAIVLITQRGDEVATDPEPEPRVVAAPSPTPVPTQASEPDPTVTPEPAAVPVAFDTEGALASAARSIVTVEAFSCTGAHTHTGVVLADGRVLTDSRALLSPWFITVSAGDTSSTARPLTSDINRRLGLVEPDLASFVSSAAATQAATEIGDRVVIVEAGGDHIEADLISGTSAAPSIIADLSIPEAVRFDHAIPAFDTDGDLVGIALEGNDQLRVVPIEDFETGWNRVPPRQDCRSTVRDLSGADADQAVSEEIRELLLLQRLTDAFANEQWDDVRAWEPGKANLTDQTFINGWGPLRQSFIYPVERQTIGDNEAEWRLGLIGHETWAGADLTTLFCVSWQVDSVAGTVIQTNADTVVVFGSQAGNPQQPGFVDPADLIDVISQRCPR